MTIDAGVDGPLRPWLEVRTAIDRFDEADLRRELEAAVGTLEGPAVNALDARIGAAVGAWYGGNGAWRAGNESFGGCWCHSPVARLTAAPQAERTAAMREEAVAWLVGEVRLLVEALRGFASIYDALDRGAQGAARERVVEAAIDALIDLVAQRTQCSESWYRFVADGVTWLCDALGAPRGGVVDTLRQTIRTVFSSWTAPAPAARRAATQSLAACIAQTVRPLPAPIAARAARVLRPPRELEPALLDDVAGLEGAAAVEALIARGLLDASWARDARRGFARLDAKTALEPATEVARDAELYALLASDSRGVATAEALAQEFAQRAAPWAGADAGPVRVVWVRGRRVEGYSYRRMLSAFSAPFVPIVRAAGALSGTSDPAPIGDGGDDDAWETAIAPLLRADASPAALRAQCIDAAALVHAAVIAQARRFGYETGTVGTLWSAAVCWSVLCAAGMRAPDRAAATALGLYDADATALIRAAPPGEPLAAASDPLDALMALWDTGYVVHAFDPTARVVTLLAPDPRVEDTRW